LQGLRFEESAACLIRRKVQPAVRLEQSDSITLDCSELTNDELPALASEISDSLEGKALALLDNKKIVLDELGKDEVSVEEVERVAGPAMR
jgi:hypothetical protein